MSKVGTRRARSPRPTGESRLALVRRARRINARAGRALPRRALRARLHQRRSSWSVATILSAQCTDKRVNEVTPTVFARYPTAADYAAADRAELEDADPSPPGFFRNKTDVAHRARRRRCATATAARCPGGSRTSSRCPGVGRKTANVVLGNAFGVPGITVDTHFGRLVAPVRLDGRGRPGQGRARGRRAVRRARTGRCSRHRVIFHGRRRCHARKPACGACPVARLCPSYGEGPTDPVVAAALVKDVP